MGTTQNNTAPTILVRNPLRRDGTSQRQRFPAALDEEYVKIDERNLEDFLVYANQYAGLINFYDQGNQLNGDWVTFFDKDISVNIALIAKYDVKALKTAFDDAMDTFVGANTNDNFEDLFARILDIGMVVEGWRKKVIPESGLADLIAGTIEGDLRDALKKLIAYDKGATTESTGHIEQDYSGFPSNWFYTGETAGSISEDTTIYTGGSNVAERANAARYVQVVFEAFYNAALVISDRAPNFLEESLSSYQYHQPHMALYIAFIQLFKHAQDHINTLTLRHLDFYYKEVLRFTEKDEEPDSIHVIFEPGRNTTQHRVEAGTAIGAGRDDTGVNLNFTTDRELILSQAQVESLKTVFLDREEENDTLVYASPDADSADGEGAPLLSVDKKWATLGQSQDGLSVANRTMPDATLGFAISSPVLLLGEGERIAGLALLFDKTDSFLEELSLLEVAGLEVDLCNNLKLEFSGEEGWFESAPSFAVVVTSAKPLGARSEDVGVLAGAVSDALQPHQGAILIGTHLNSEAPKIVAYDSELITDGLDTTHPTAKVTFTNSGFAFESTINGTSPLFTYSAYVASNTYAPDAIVAFEGRVYQAVQSATNESLTDTNYWTPVTSLEAFTEAQVTANPSISAYEKETQYILGQYVYLNQKSYRLLENPVSPSPTKSPSDWEETDFDPLGVPAYDPEGIYEAGDPVEYFGRVYEAKRDSIPLGPIEDPEIWCEEMDYSRVNPYRFMENLSLENVVIKVRAEGMSDLVLHNDDGKLDPAQSFTPFTARPVVGSNFYIGSPEVFNKRLDMIDLHVEWEGLPAESFNEYYMEYRGEDPMPGDFVFGHKQYARLFAKMSLDKATNTAISHAPWLWYTIGNNRFKARVYFLDGESWSPSPTDTTIVQLFGNNTDGSPSDSRTWNLSANLPNSRDPKNTDFSNYEAGIPRGFMRLELMPTGSSAPTLPYVAVLDVAAPVSYETETKVDDNSIALNTYLAGITMNSDGTYSVWGNVVGPSEPDDLPNEPYTPVMAKLELDYESTAIIDLQQEGRAAYDGRVERYYQIAPFGHNEVHAFLLEGDEQANILTPFPNEGHLYVGLSGLNVPQTLPLFFQMAEGSGDPELNRPDVTWSVLVNNKWVDIESNSILHDSTNGLLTSGIIEFTLSKFATSDNTILPAGQHWLRAVVAGNTPAISQVVEVRTNAVAATYVNNGNDPERLRTPLAEDSVKKLLVRDSAVKKLSQPYTSFGGRVRESGSDFYTRVAERLRHKQRSITIFDYERMVLEQFPSIYKVKCLNHTAQTGGVDTYCELRPGHVMVVCIPDLRNKNAINPFEPRTTLNKLEEIRSYLLNYITPFIDLKVKNPFYEKVEARFDVGFHEGYDPGFYAQELNEGIKRFLSPWAFEEGEDIIFGGKVHWSVILNYIEEQPYVDFVNNFRLDHIANGVRYKDVEEAVATTSRSILVSADDHLINVLDPGTAKCEGDKVFSGIDFWIVEGDFVVQ